MHQHPGIHLVNKDEWSPTLASCYRLHRDSVYRTCLRYGGGRAAWAEDATHDVFVKLIQSLPRLTDPDELGGWLYRVTANLCISRLRREQSWLRGLQRLWSAPRPAQEEVLDCIQAQEEAALALATLRALPARQSVVFCMKVIEDRSQRDIAELLGISEGYVSKLLARAWSRIRAAGWEGGDEQG